MSQEGHKALIEAATDILTEARGKPDSMLVGAFMHVAVAIALDINRIADTLEILAERKKP